MTKEYIERRKVSNACYEVFEDIVRQPKLFTAEEVWQELLRFERAINSVPTANVVEVKHGRWVVTREHDDVLDTEVAKYACSVCQEYRFSTISLSQATNYCPNCGARMDGGVDHD